MSLTFTRGSVLALALGLAIGGTAHSQTAPYAAQQAAAFASLARLVNATFPVGARPALYGPDPDGAAGPASRHPPPYRPPCITNRWAIQSRNDWPRGWAAAAPAG